TITGGLSRRSPILPWQPNFVPPPFGMTLGSPVLSSLLEHPSMNIISHPQIVSRRKRRELIFATVWHRSGITN
ncbi:hypothetical protein ACC754_44145, partial [Rhizobium johnstonii]